MYKFLILGQAFSALFKTTQLPRDDPVVKALGPLFSICVCVYVIFLTFILVMLVLQPFITGGGLGGPTQK